MNAKHVRQSLAQDGIKTAEDDPILSYAEVAPLGRSASIDNYAMGQ